ncbi:hypothetical protein ANO14919_064060 [Xylariales sp. No.14919]|nr:hypothetical protein ANO14919_064060 [Xylariales sp. No.14919]
MTMAQSSKQIGCALQGRVSAAGLSQSHRENENVPWSVHKEPA